MIITTLWSLIARNKYMIYFGLFLAVSALFYFYGLSRYQDGYGACEVRVIEKTVYAERESVKQSGEVRKDEQKLENKRDVVDGLRGLGILREDSGD